jgi:hypothetical protein
MQSSRRGAAAGVGLRAGVLHEQSVGVQHDDATDRNTQCSV